MSEVANILSAPEARERGRRRFLFSLANLIFFSGAGHIRFDSPGFFFTASRLMFLYFIVVFSLGAIGLCKWQGNNITKVVKGVGYGVKLLIGLCILLFVIIIALGALGLVWEILKWLFAA